MFYKKAKRVLAGICAFTLIMSGIGETACVAMAAESEQIVIETEYKTEESEEKTENYEDKTVNESLVDEYTEDAFSENTELESETEIFENVQTETKQETEAVETSVVETETVETNVTELETDSVISTENESETETEELFEIIKENVDKNTTEEENVVTNVNGLQYTFDEETGTITIVASQGNIPKNALVSDENSAKIKHITFEEGSEITIVSEMAFSRCLELESVDFTNCDDLTTIDKYAFSNCTALEEVKLSSNLQYIKKQAFENCTALTEIILTESLILVESNAFYKCEKLSRVVVNANNISDKNPNSINGIFSGCCIDTIEFPANNTVVPSSLFRGAAFAEDANIVIPKHIQEIGQLAFSGSNIKTISFEGESDNTSKLSSIGESAFENCTGLNNFNFPTSLKTIENNAFKNCSSLTKVDILNTITALGNSAFEGCTKLNDLKLSNATTTLGEYVFKGCISLTRVVIPDGLTNVSKGEFFGCIMLSELTIADTVTTIGDNAFENCSSLAQLTIPNSVTQIGACAFKKCISLDDPDLSEEITVLSNSIFEECTSLKTITIPEKVTKIGDKAFYKCDKLNPLQLPIVVEEIGVSAFEECTGISNLKLPENIKTIKSYAFKGCTLINTLTIESNVITSCGYGIFSDCYIKKVEFPEGITEIPAYLFNRAQFTTNTTITIPKTVTKIGDYAFAGNSEKGNNIFIVDFEEGSQLNEIGNNVFEYCTAIENFEIPESTTKIGQRAFSNCKKLSEIIITENIVSIGAAAFSECEVLATINYNAINAVININSNNKDSAAIFKDCNINKIAIGEKVEILPAYLFYGAKFSDNDEEDIMFVDLTVPAAVEEIGEWSFANISNIRTITFEKGSSFTELGAYAFNSCVALEKCILPDTVTTIGNSAFRGCTKLKEFKLPASLITLGDDAFYQCSSMESYTIPSGTEAILNNTFFENIALTDITFEGLNITQIGDNAFYGCDKLKAINIPQGTLSIGMNAFKNCTQLLSVRIPDSVKEIEEGAFANCIKATFYVVKDSYADEWLINNGFESQIQYMYSITYVLYDGINDVRNIGGYLDGDIFTFFEATKKGSSFDGWFLEEALETEVKDLTGRIGDFTLYAKWDMDTYDILYELDGGLNNEKNPASYTVDSEDIILEAPIKSGYVFGGWYTDREFTNNSAIKKITADMASDIVLYAKWTPINYTIKFNANGGTGSIEDIQVVGDEPFIIPGIDDSFVREGYTLKGFNTRMQGDGISFEPGECVSSIVESTNINQVVTLYAQWKKDMLNTVEAPLSNYKSGSEVFAGTKVILSTITKGAAIYYTLDGSEPTINSLLYTDGIAINEETNIRAIAIKEGFNDSIIVTYTYTVIDEASYWGEITDEDKSLYEDPTKVPNGIWIAGVKDAVYTGNQIKFELRVYDHKTLLTEKKDYTVKYSNNKKAATENNEKAPVITITAKGDYKGTIKKKFNILPLDINSEGIVAEDMYASVNGRVQKPVPSLIFGKTKLKNKKDFTVAYQDYANGFSTEGSYIITLTGKGNFSGTRTVKFELKNATLISKTKISKIKAVEYTGEAITPKVTITYKGTTLVENTDYTLGYQDNVFAGTATVIITGIGNYTGIKKVSFKINPISQLKKATVVFNKDSVEYTGEAIELNKGDNPISATLTYAGNTLEIEKDYIIDGYSKNINKGTATVVFKGIGGYSGTVKKKFKITAASITAARVQFVDDNGNLVDTDAVYAYSKGGCKPNIVVTFNGRQLAAKTDYTIKYSGNTKEGTAKITLKGAKNFTSELISNFSIIKQDISKLNIEVQDMEYQPQKTDDITYFSKPEIKDLNGKTLKEGVDYSENYEYTYAKDCSIKRNGRSMNIKAGEKVLAADDILAGSVIKVTVNGKSNYTGSINGEYVIVTHSISKATASVKVQEYTGKAVTPGKDQITVQLSDGYKLKDTEYEIIGYSNNVSKGTATVTLRGTGNFGGTINAKFKIKQKNFSLAELLSFMKFNSK